VGVPIEPDQPSRWPARPLDVHVDYDMNDRVDEAVNDSHEWFPEWQHNREWLPWWLLALGGEVGELQNKAKKWRRGSLTWEEVKPLLADELVDVLVYAFDVAACLEIDLEAEYDRKREFNQSRFGHHKRRSDADAEGRPGRTE
jgi:NTP pyrophosphatase (non-canonical NTP hydrolase)